MVDLKVVERRIQIPARSVAVIPGWQEPEQINVHALECWNVARQSLEPTIAQETKLRGAAWMATIQRHATQSIQRSGRNLQIHRAIRRLYTAERTVSREPCANQKNCRPSVTVSPGFRRMMTSCR